MSRRIKKPVEDACYFVWLAHRISFREKTITIEKLWSQLDKEGVQIGAIPIALAGFPEKDWPKKSWFTKRISKIWEPNTPFEELPEDPIIRPWDTNWGDDPRRVFVLTVLFDQAKGVFASQDIDIEFEGFTTRVSKWAVKLSEFFDLNVRRDRLLLIVYANIFAQEERLNLMRPNDAASTYPEIPKFGHEQLVAWQRHKMGIKEPRPISHDDLGEVNPNTYVWEVSEGQLEMAIPKLGLKGTTILFATLNGEPSVLTIIL